MKRLMFLLVICMMSGITYAGNVKKSPTVDNSSIRRSERLSNKQTRQFANNRHFSSVTHNHRAKALKKQQAKSSNGNGL